jgi:chromosome segregation ATPase
MLREATCTWRVWPLLVCLAVTACAPTYDSTADQMVVNTEKTLDDGLVKLEGLKASIDSTRAAVDSNKADAVALSAEIASLKASKNPSDKQALADAQKALAASQKALADHQKVLSDYETQASYASNIGFYDTLQSQIIQMKSRITSSPDYSTPAISTSIEKLQSNVAQLRAVHLKKNVLDVSFLQGMQVALDQEFMTLNKYELTIKNGKTP